MTATRKERAVVTGSGHRSCPGHARRIDQALAEKHEEGLVEVGTLFVGYYLVVTVSQLVACVFALAEDAFETIQPEVNADPARRNLPKVGRWQLLVEQLLVRCSG